MLTTTPDHHNTDSRSRSRRPPQPPSTARRQQGPPRPSLACAPREHTLSFCNTFLFPFPQMTLIMVDVKMMKHWCPVLAELQRHKPAHPQTRNHTSCVRSYAPQMDGPVLCAARSSGTQGELRHEPRSVVQASLGAERCGTGRFSWAVCGTQQLRSGAVRSAPGAAPPPTHSTTTRRGEHPSSLLMSHSYRMSRG